MTVCTKVFVTKFKCHFIMSNEKLKSLKEEIIAIERKVKSDLEIDSEKYQAWLLSWSYNYLARYPSSVQKFSKKLLEKSKQYPPYNKSVDTNHCLHETIVKLKEKKLLDDEYLAKRTLEIMRKKGKSLQLIKTKLYNMQIDKTIISSLISDIKLDTNQEEQAAIIYMQRKKIGAFAINKRYAKSSQSKEELFKKQLNSMLRQGFSFDLCKKLLAMDLVQLQEMANDMSKPI